MRNSIIENKSFGFAVRIVNLYKFLFEKKEYVMSKQVLRSGTSIGANVSEALEAQSKKDYVAKMNIALKECAETIYWIRLLAKTDYILSVQADSLLKDATEIKKILSSIIITTKGKMGEDER